MKRLTDANKLPLVYGNCEFCENCKIDKDDHESGFACKMTTMYSKLHCIENYMEKYCSVINKGVTLIETDNIEDIENEFDKYYKYNTIKCGSINDLINFVNNIITRGNYIVDIRNIDFDIKYIEIIRAIADTIKTICTVNKGIIIFITKDIDKLIMSFKYMSNTIIKYESDNYRIIKSDIYEKDTIKTIDELF